MWVCYFTTNCFVILRDVCELYTWNLVNRMLCVALREHVQTVSPIRASLCSLRLSEGISKLSKLLTLTLAVSRREILRAVENLQCSTNIEQRRWHLVKFCAGGSHLFSRATYQIVALKLDFTFTNKCIYYLRRSLLAIRRRKKWEISLTIVHASFTLYALSCRYFHLQCVVFFLF